MDGKREVLSASALAHAIEVVRRAFIREQLGELDSLAAQVLVLIAAEPKLSVKRCAERLSASQPNVSSALSRLEAKGLVVRGASRDDKRIKVLDLTPEGEAEVRQFLNVQV